MVTVSHNLSIRPFRVTPCVGGRLNHFFNGTSRCIYCRARRPEYYEPSYRHAGPDADPWVEGYESRHSENPYRSGTKAAKEWLRGWLMRAGAITVSLLITFRAHAAILTFDINRYPIAITTSAPVPDLFGYAITGGLVQRADADAVTGGQYFPDRSGDHGWTFLPLLIPANIPSQPWSFELFVSNPAIWQIDIAGAADQRWNVIGEVTSGFDFLQGMGRWGLRPLGTISFPVAQDGEFYTVTSVDMETPGFPVFVPEPPTLAVLAAGVLILLSRRMRMPRRP